jgi:hypothetical protein
MADCGMPPDPQVFSTPRSDTSNLLTTDIRASGQLRLVPSPGSRDYGLKERLKVGVKDSVRRNDRDHFRL